ncbi:MAG TPA: hypothetical protein PK073_00085 [Ignavibacteriaceae bacterium]|nr:MAG: hypothetical protein BWY38_01733 [Ignavibacteria bacterium ADurb.Bin266]OQY70058.1 MAG: hypothetical protein B6D44_16545 [Ignavibacteriales bacterium UTCHB2]HQF41275.1 hypothetical protein [Ignavibacteriaceae bacterium]HQI40524.1 hypothetical protein [Ignavibacteriaceae bacterium]
MEEQLTKELTKSKLTDDFDAEFEKTAAKPISFSELPNWNNADISLQNKIQFVLKRLSLAKSLQDDEVAKWINASNEPFELSALRTYLLLSCANMLGEISRTDNPISFLAWLDTTNSVTTRSIREESISKAIGSVGVVDDQKKAVKLIKSVFAQYKLTNSVDSNYFSFFTDALDTETQNWISSNCWIYQDNPLEKWANLQNVKEGYNNLSSAENKRLTNARKRWDNLDSNQRLFEVSQFLEFLFNQYNLCMVNQPVKMDKDPVAKVWRDIDQAVSEYKVNYLSNSLFNHLGSDGQKFKFNEVRCVFKEEELIVFEGDVREKDRELWLKRLSEWLKTKIESENATGETIFLGAKNQALVLSGENLITLLEKWIDKGVKNILNKK